MCGMLVTGPLCVSVEQRSMMPASDAPCWRTDSESAVHPRGLKPGMLEFMAPFSCRSLSGRAPKSHQRQHRHRERAVMYHGPSVLGCAHKQLVSCFGTENTDDAFVTTSTHMQPLLSRRADKIRWGW